MTRYFVLAIVGTILPLALFTPFLFQDAPTVQTFVRQLFATPAASMFTADLVVSSIAFWLFASVEGRRLGMPHLWVYIACNLLVGLSLALPLFLYARAKRCGTSRCLCGTDNPVCAPDPDVCGTDNPVCAPDPDVCGTDNPVCADSTRSTDRIVGATQ